MNEIFDRISAIQARIGEIQSRFGPAAPSQSFSKALDQAAATGGASATAAPAATAAAGGTQAWAPAIAGAAAREHVDPALVRAVMSAESGGNPNALSPVGAEGLMQLMPGTAQSLGVDAANPLDNLEGGAKYLGELTHRFGLENGVAAYNAGPHAVEKYGGVPPYAETQAYVQKVLSLYNQFKRPEGAPGR